MMQEGKSTETGTAKLKMSDFVVTKQIASAKCCTVHSAEWGAQKMPVALKVYDKANMSPGRCQSVRREARMMRNAQRYEIPHSVQVYGMIEDEDNLVIVMELYGDVLEALLKRGCALSERQACKRVILPVLASLAMMHAHQMVHRDIKLENMFLDSQTAVRLGDFGLTISLKEESSVSQIGTVEYMAPEIVLLPTSDDYQQGRINPLEVQGTGTAVDIWALGVSMYELVSGSCPFNSRDKAVIKQNILDNEILPLPSVITDSCKDFIRSMMTYDRRTRPTAFMLAHHPFIRQHCSPEEIVAVAGSPTHPFNQIDWNCSPSTRFGPFDNRCLPQPDCRRTSSTSSMDHAAQEAKPCAAPATDACVAGPARLGGAASPASSFEHSSQSSTRSAGWASRSPLRGSMDRTAAQQLETQRQLFHGLDNQHADGSASPKQFASEYSKFTATWSSRIGDSSESSKNTSRKGSSRLQPTLGQAQLGRARSIKHWCQPTSQSMSRAASDSVAAMTSE